MTEHSPYSQFGPSFRAGVICAILTLLFFLFWAIPTFALAVAMYVPIIAVVFIHVRAEIVKLIAAEKCLDKLLHDKEK